MSTIAVFSGYYYPHLGGIERYIDGMMHEFIRMGHKVILITSNYNNSISEEVIGDIKIFRLPVFKIFKNRYPIIKKNKEYKEIIKKLDDYKIDRIIVNTRFHLTSHIGAKYGKKKNIPVYLIEHGSNYVTLDNKFIDFFANRYEDFLTYKIKNKVTGFYGVSKACSSWLENFDIKSHGVWYNSIDFNQKIPEKKEHKEINFLYAGRLIKQKGVKNILDAFSKLEKKYNNIHLYIAGNGPEYNEYVNTYKSENISFLGKLTFDKLLKYYALTDVFLYPPLWPEGLPTSILEAGMMGCMTIGTDQGGIIEIIKNKKNGIIVKENIESLYDAMKLMIDNKELRKKYSNELNRTVKEKFSWESTANKILEDIGEK